VVRRVWRRDEIYEGPQTERAPDLILELETPDEYSYVCMPSLGRPGISIERMEPATLHDGKLAGMSGSHRRQGIFVAAGEGIPARRLRGVQMTDMAPTILGLCGLEPVAAMQGRALAKIAENAKFTKILLESDPGDEQYYDAADEEAIRRRLEQLGYLS
jgi:predicted AlkP superfamily phosphohydrolase/phosphomutase